MKTANIAAMLFALATWLYPIKVASAQIKTEHVIPPTNVLSSRNSNNAGEDSQPVRVPSTSKARASGGRHSTRAERNISVEALQMYLQQQRSPLAGYGSELLASRYWSTVIGICAIEERNCTINPYETNNFWGLMARGHLKSFPTMERGILAINDYLDNLDSNGYSTVESLNCYYVQPCSQNWLNVVLKTKATLENLDANQP